MHGEAFAGIDQSALGSLLPKDDIIQVSGTVIEVLPSAMFKVKLDESENIVLGVISGKMRQHKIRVYAGDRVDMELSVYDLTRGRIVRRT